MFHFRPPWKGFRQSLTPIVGLDVPLPNIFHQIKSQDAAGVRTASFTNWEWFRYMTSLGYPTAVDHDYYCHMYDWCDRQLVAAAVAYLDVALRSADASYTFVYIGRVDADGEQKGFCGPEYMKSVDEADRLVGLLMDAVDRAERSPGPGRRSGVAVMLTSDHGGHDHSHFSFQDSDVVVPAFVRGPRATGSGGGVEREAGNGSMFRREIRNVDYAPTAVEWLGLKPSRWWKGDVMDEEVERSRRRVAAGG